MDATTTCHGNSGLSLESISLKAWMPGRAFPQLYRGFNITQNKLLHGDSDAGRGLHFFVFPPPS